MHTYILSIFYFALRCSGYDHFPNDGNIYRNEISPSNLVKYFFTLDESKSSFEILEFEPKFKNINDTKDYYLSIKFKFRISEDHHRRVNGFGTARTIMIISHSGKIVGKFCIIDAGILQFRSGETVLTWDKKDYGSKKWHNVKIIWKWANDHVGVDVDGQKLTANARTKLSWINLSRNLTIIFGFSSLDSEHHESSINACFQNVGIFVKKYGGVVAVPQKFVVRPPAAASLSGCRRKNDDNEDESQEMGVRKFHGSSYGLKYQTGERRLRTLSLEYQESKAIGDIERTLFRTSMGEYEFRLTLSTSGYSGMSLIRPPTLNEKILVEDIKQAGKWHSIRCVFSNIDINCRGDDGFPHKLNVPSPIESWKNSLIAKHNIIYFGENFHGRMRNMQMNDEPLIVDQILNDTPLRGRPLEKLRDFVNDDGEGAKDSPPPTSYEIDEEPTSDDDYTSSVFIVSNTTKIPIGGSSNVCNEGYCQQGVCKVDEVTGSPGCECMRGFSGKRCQFSNFPTSCQELRLYLNGIPLFHSKARSSASSYNGYYRILPSITKNLSYDNVPIMKCEFGDQTSRTTSDTVNTFENTKSIIEHSFPTRKLVRGQNMTDFTVKIRYNHIDIESMKHLMEISKVCKQAMVYECSNSPLKFPDKHTKFASLLSSNRSFYHLGSLNDPDEKPSCSSESPDECHCDRKDSTAADHGQLYGREAGIWKTSFKQLAKGDVDALSEAYWTLGNVTCEGIGWNESIQLKNTSLEMPLEWTGQKLTFRFKTDQQNAVLIEQRHEGNIFYLGFENASTLKLSLKVGVDPNIETSLLAQRPLDDNRWHTIILEYKSNQMRLIVDYRKEVFLNLEKDSENLGKYFQGNLIFGGSGANFSGCLSYLAIENRPIDFIGLIKGPKLQNGCQDLCLEQSLNCLNGGRCIENYSRQSSLCLCPDFVTGEFCENDINKDTDITLFDAMKSYALITNFTENPLTNDISFDFRTDQIQGLLLYVHDQFHNFRQLHLWSSNKLTLTTNYGRSIRQCTVSNVEKDLDTMQWIHVEIGRRDDHVILKVGDLWCKLDGPQDYSLSYVENWANEQDAKDVVRPPVFPPYLLAQFVAILPTMTMTFAGGVPKTGITRPRRQIINAGVYSSSLPSLMGSVRGLKIGGKDANLRHFVQDSDNRLVFNGSYFRCDEIDCQNNGKCTVDWAGNNHRGRPKLSCDCSQTSYNGDNCNEDNGVPLDGRTFLSFTLPETRIDANLLQPYDVVSIAFAVSPPSKFGDKELNEQRLNSDVDWARNDGVVLASLSFSANFRIVMRLVHNRTHSCLRITMNTSPAEKLEFFGNFFDQRRHMVYMRFLNQDAQILFRIDQQQSIERNMPEYFSFSRLDQLNIGGGLGVHEINFQGTISTGSYVKFMGSTYFVGGRRFVLLWENHPIDPPTPFTLVECPKFDAQNGNFKMVSDNMEHMMPPIKHPPFEILPFEEDYAAVSLTTEPGETSSSNSGLIIGLILGAITAFILLTMVLVCKFSGRGGRQRARHVIADEDRKGGFKSYEPEGVPLKLEQQNLIEKSQSPSITETNANKESLVEKTESVMPSQDYSPANGKLTQSQQQDATTSFSDTKKRSASVVVNGTRKRSTNDNEKKVRIASCSEMFAEI